MFDDLSEQHIVSLILDSCPYRLKNAYKYKYKYKSSCKLHMIRLIPTNIINTLINSTCASTTTVHQYLIYPCTTILYYPLRFYPHAPTPILVLLYFSTIHRWTVPSTTTTTTARGLGELLDVTELGRQV